MTSQSFYSLCLYITQMLRKLAPYDTGNLALNAIRIEFIDEKTCRILVDESIAPYMVFTNEVWINRAGRNPNEHWFDHAAEFIAQQVQGRLHADLRRSFEA